MATVASGESGDKERSSSAPADRRLAWMSATASLLGALAAAVVAAVALINVLAS